MNEKHAYIKPAMDFPLSSVETMTTLPIKNYTEQDKPLSVNLLLTFQEAPNKLRTQGNINPEITENFLLLKFRDT